MCVKKMKESYPEEIFIPSSETLADELIRKSVVVQIVENKKMYAFVTVTVHLYDRFHVITLRVC